MKYGTVTLLTKNPKHISISWHILWVLLIPAYFHEKSATLVMSRNRDIDCILINVSNSFQFSESLRVILVKPVAILMMSAKLATQCLLKKNVFWNEGYDVIIFFHDVTNKILLRDSNYIVDVVTWPKSGKSSISMREVIITSAL